MSGTNQYRHESNPDEKKFYDVFNLHYGDNPRAIGQIIFKVNGYGDPERLATDPEMDIAANIIQWLGSPVGQGFLLDCGFEKVKR